ncbi:hypothetical protein [Stenotrophomonas rhizophila]|uniref:hypothetical protein n=1 Tax=Stenotrophomonas rhizophila TaxID=216778 RepID=UPI001E40533F|nr:hypothetical protein [Stenotrophomonas rhizophila]MCC7634390.1 hypothetical protein [Stenotrophomonas rhizophila]MCC7663788.1 hypothetical protein [Stenotrophomonas rhizophila]
MSILQLAKRLNLDVERIERGETLDASVTAQTPEHYRELLGPLTGITPAHRPYARHHLAESCCRDCYGAGLLHFSDFLTGAVSSIDPEIGSEFFKRRFPMTIKLTIAKQITVTENKEFPAGTAPVFIACENLVFNGGSYVLRNTAFTLWVTHQLSIVSAGTLPYHIGILGAPGADGSPGHDGPPMPPASHGSNAGTPSPGICTGAGSGGHGPNGLKGNDGHNGGPAVDGLPSVLSSLNIASFASPQAPLVVFGQSGQGGNGGPAGNGGPGQQGGRGGNGCNSGCEGTDGGNGGDGGQGGTGGVGGPGGNSPNGGQLHVNLAPAQQGANFFVYQTAMAKPGRGGALGAAGERGARGTGGSGGHHSRNGTDGALGTPGTPGTKGNDGTQFGAPPQLIPGNYTPPSA